MNKNLQNLKNFLAIQQSIDCLDRNKIHVLYFSYKLNWHNFIKGPLLIFTKALNFITNKPSIDHVCHISRFIQDDEGNWYARVFEANMDQGMEENDLMDKLQLFQGVCYIETLGVVDKIKAKAFENKYLGVPYSKKLAALSGIDIKLIDNLFSKRKNGGFCSWLETLFLQDQLNTNITIQKLDPLEATPTDLFCLNLGQKNIFYQS